MIPVLIWQRYLFKQALSVFLFFIVGFYFLYILIDYSVHVKNFTQAHFSFLDLFFYYSSHLTKRAGIIIPFALMLATIKTLTSINTKRELIALFAGGLSSTKILKPFFFLALLCVGLLYLNAEFLLPNGELYLKSSERDSIENKIDEKKPNLFAIQMKDGSVLVYQNFDPQQKLFFDAFWIKDNHHITRIKYLDAANEILIGRYVDVLIRNAKGQFIRQDAFEEIPLPTLHLEEAEIQELAVSASAEPLTQLLQKVLHHSKTNLEENGELVANFFYKLLMPLITFVVILIPAPYCMRFGRNLPIFLIYCLAISGFVLLITLMDAAFIVAENQLLPPSLTLLLPIVAIYLIAIYHYYLLKN